MDEPAFLLNLVGRAGAEVGGYAAINDIEQIDRLPLLSLGRMDGRQDQVVIVDDAGNGDDFGIYYKVADGDETSVTFTGGGADYQTACVVEIDGTGGF